MLKFSGRKNDGGRIVGLGLSDGNLQRLREGKPILFNLATLGLMDCDVLIFWGATEELMAEQMAQLVGPDTKRAPAAGH